MKFIPHFILILFLTACVSQNAEIDFDQKLAAKARVELALGYLSQQDWEQAKQNLDKALSYAPDYYLVHSAFAYFYQQQGNITQARESYLKAIKLDDKQGDVHNNYGTFLCSQGEFQAAYQQFDLAVASPNYYRQADSYENKALCALSENNQAVYQQSKIALEKADPERAKKLR
ncbi:type IV pilus biogenesis/stability protein PilW [Lonepinella sp. BR2930]|uniref:type IV pilus biogenesis/stability protein PilW n=1 Tax=Lonepinella sp. BR2930 TaxID=3434554 RepID=UPI003F6E19BA